MSYKIPGPKFKRVQSPLDARRAVTTWARTLFMPFSVTDRDTEPMVAEWLLEGIAEFEATYDKENGLNREAKGSDFEFFYRRAYKEARRDKTDQDNPPLDPSTLIRSGAAVYRVGPDRGTAGSDVPAQGCTAGRGREPQLAVDHWARADSQEEAVRLRFYLPDHALSLSEAKSAILRADWECPCGYGASYAAYPGLESCPTCGMGVAK
jgi:hypothetical protein